jgi:hypothetical protein
VSGRIQICWRNSRAKSDNKETALYFRDLSDPASSFGSCVNYYDGRAVATTRLRCKVEYISLGIWHRLDIDAKIQKPGKIGINNIPLWTTCKEGSGELNWSASFKAVFRGRCSGDLEQIYNSQDLQHPVSNENKGRKVLWERVRGLRYYCVEMEQAGVYTNNAFLGPASDQQFCPPNNRILYSVSPRIISTPEFDPTSTVPGSYLLQISSNTVCQ